MERCILCGGKIGSNGKCLECGLDNTKNDKKYRLNTHNEKTVQLHHGACEDNLNKDSGRKKKEGPGKKKDGAPGKKADNAPEKKQNAWEMAKDGMTEAQREKKAKTRRQAGTVKKKSGVARFVRWVVILIIVIELLSAVSELLPEVIDELGLTIGDSEPVFWPKEEPDVEKPELIKWDQASAGYFEAELTAGFYEAGYEIPAGRYQMYCEEGSAWMTCREETGRYFSLGLSSLEQQEAYREQWGESSTDFELSEEIEFSDGDILYIRNCDESVRIAGEGDGGASLKDHEEQKIRGQVVLDSRDQTVAGVDFAEGVYDIALAGEVPEWAYSGAGVEIEEEDGSYHYIDLSKENPIFYRFPFKAGDKIGLSIYLDDIEVILAPSY